MLPRHAVPVFAAARARRPQHLVRSPRPADPALAAWLEAPGSLTGRLKVHGKVVVQVRRQGSQRLWPCERQALGTRGGHVREVALLLDGRPVVWARSATCHEALRGPWKALAGLGTRPLAELLFQGRHVCRQPLERTRLRRQGPACRHLGPPPGTQDAPAWVRHSVFWHGGRPLLVMEAISPCLRALNAHGQGKLL